MDMYDFLYVDIEKVVSIYSQITGGIVEVSERSTENSNTSDNKRNYDFKIFKHNAGGTESDKESLKEVVKPHHALIKETEERLLSSNLLIDFTREKKSLRDYDFRKLLKETFCIKVKGRALIEDYERLKTIASAFPDVLDMVNRSVVSTAKNSPEYGNAIATIDAVRSEIKLEKDRNIRATKERQLKELTKKLDSYTEALSKNNGIEQWILDGMKTWIDTFLPGIVNLRIYPTTEAPDEHVFGHLKKQCFVDQNSNSLHFTYGSFPTEELTLVLLCH